MWSYSHSSCTLEAGPELCPKCKTGKGFIKNSSIKLPKQKIIQVLLDSGSDGDRKERLKAILTRQDKFKSHGIRQMGFSIQKEKEASRLIFLNTAIASMLPYNQRLLNIKIPRTNQLLTSYLVQKPWR